jgi:hypothetical protein
LARARGRTGYVYARIALASTPRSRWELVSSNSGEQSNVRSTGNAVVVDVPVTEVAVTLFVIVSLTRIEFAEAVVVCIVYSITVGVRFVKPSDRGERAHQHDQRGTRQCDHRSKFYFVGSLDIH